jgi:hypothetical protein
MLIRREYEYKLKLVHIDIAWGRKVYAICQSRFKNSWWFYVYNHTLYSLLRLPFVHVGKSRPSTVLNWTELLENTSLITYGPVYNASNLAGSSNLRASWTMTHILSNSICLRWHLSNATFRHHWITSTCWAVSWHPSFRAPVRLTYL